MNREEDDWLGQSRRRKRPRGETKQKGGEEEGGGASAAAAAAASADATDSASSKKRWQEPERKAAAGGAAAAAAAPLIDLSGEDAKEEGGGAAAAAAVVAAGVPDGEEHEGCRAVVTALRAEVAALRRRLLDVMGGVPVCESTEGGKEAAGSIAPPSCSLAIMVYHTQTHRQAASAWRRWTTPWS